MERSEVVVATLRGGKVPVVLPFDLPAVEAETTPGPSPLKVGSRCSPVGVGLDFDL